MGCLVGVPTLMTKRLKLRGFSHGDIADVVRLAGDIEIARMTLLVPHPYETRDAEVWISSHEAAFNEGKSAEFAITLHDGTLIGAIAIVFSKQHERAEIGYWIGVPFWGKGYATEAASEIVRYGFEDRGQARLTAHHFAHNPASGRVIEKIGMKREGLFPKHVKKWGEFVDCVMYGMLREDWRTAPPGLR